MKKIEIIAAWFIQQFHGITLGVFLLFGSFCPVLGQGSSMTIHQSIQHRTDVIFDSLVRLRRDFHRHPELSGEEGRTAAVITNYLKELGLEVYKGIGGHGVVGVLRGDGTGKKIAWRADMDALSMEVNDDQLFSSIHNDIHHFCGHDVHMTIALGIANNLVHHKEDIKGTVFFIFQPSEENYQGAKAMINDGLLDLIDPDEIYGTHISPMPVGLVASKPGFLFADYKKITITFREPAQETGLEAYTKELFVDLQNRKDESSFWDTRNLMDPEIGIGNPKTIFHDYITVRSDFEVIHKDGDIQVTSMVSASSKAIMDSIPIKLRDKINESSYKALLKHIKFAEKGLLYSTQRANIQNDPTLAKNAIRTMSEIYGDDHAIPLYGVIPDGRGDDFAYFQDKIPGVYFLLGGSNFKKGIIAMPHSLGFRVDEGSIKAGVNYFSTLLLEQTNK
ncbi:amidohydrolase [Echinicola rosea]|nr:amidohydrolase [Echinicola rosea]